MKTRVYSISGVTLKKGESFTERIRVWQEDISAKSSGARLEDR